MNGKCVEVRDWNLVFGITAGFSQWQCRESYLCWLGWPSRRALLHSVRLQTAECEGN